MNENPVWVCLEIANDTAEVLQHAQKYSNLPQEALHQICDSLSKTRDCLTSFLHSRPNDNAFDICFGNIKKTLLEIKEEVNQLTPATGVFSFSLLRNDLLLSFRVSQLDLLFSKKQEKSKKGIELINDGAGKALWKNSFGEKVIY